MNTIEYKGHKFKIIRYAGPLYRADRTTYRVGASAKNDYSSAPVKYFTLDESELTTYVKHGMPYKKTWVPIQELILVDILHKPTRKALELFIGAESLNIAFPIRGNNVIRISEEDTKIHDDIVLKSLCATGLFDGYYMNRLHNSNGKYIFHSEVGICPIAYSKLRLENVTRNINQAAPVMASKKTGRRRYNNNNNSNMYTYNFSRRRTGGNTRSNTRKRSHNK